MSSIKPTNYEQQKTMKFKQQIGRFENMDYDTGLFHSATVSYKTDKKLVCSTSCYKVWNCFG